MQAESKVVELVLCLLLLHSPSSLRFLNAANLDARWGFAHDCSDPRGNRSVAAHRDGRVSRSEHENRENRRNFENARHSPLDDHGYSMVYHHEDLENGGLDPYALFGAVTPKTIKNKLPDVSVIYYSGHFVKHFCAFRRHFVSVCFSFSACALFAFLRHHASNHHSHWDFASVCQNAACHFNLACASLQRRAVLGFVHGSARLDLIQRVWIPHRRHSGDIT